MVKKRDDLIGIITDFPSAKNYNDYNGNPLEESEKTIFDSELLKKKNLDGTLSTDPDLDKLRDTVALLANLKEARTNLVTEKTSETGLSANGNALLVALMGERRNNSIAYQLVNEKDENEEREVDKMVRDYQKVLFKRESRKLRIEEKVITLALIEIAKKEEKTKRDIDKLEKECSPEQFRKQTKLENDINTVITALKDDLAPGQICRRILDEIVKENEIVTKQIYNSNNVSTSAMGSIIKTGYTSNGKPYTHPSFLNSEIRGIFINILKDINKDKLFEYIDSSDCSWSAKDKEKFKISFERIVSTNFNFEFGGVRKDLIRMATGYYSQRPSRQEFEKKSLYLSDIFYVMHALFPKDSNYQASPFLKVGQESCLQFNNSSKGLDIPYEVIWRGNSVSVVGTKYVLTSPDLRKAPFPWEEKYLTWANGQIPEFFWQVFNNDEVIDFNAYDETLNEDGVLERIRKEKISVYEKKFPLAVRFYHINFLEESYNKHVENVIESVKGTSGKPLIDADVYREEWERISKGIIGVVRKTFIKLSEKEKSLTLPEIKNYWQNNSSDISNRYLLLFTENRFEHDKVNSEIINFWDKWSNETADKRVALENVHAELGKKRTELIRFGAQRAKKNKELKQVQDKIKGLETGKIKNLKEQLKFLGEKLTNSTGSVITHRETMAIKTLQWLILKLDNKDENDQLEPALEKYITALKNLETSLDAILGPYISWKGLGNSFQERLDNWKNTEGKNLEEGAVRANLKVIQTILNDVKTSRGLNVEETADLSLITDYLVKEPELRDDHLQLAFNIDCDVARSLVEQWKNFGDQKLFKKDESRLEKIGNIVNDLDDVEPFFTHLKDYLKGKKGLPSFPADTAAEQDKLNWFFTLPPQHVIGAVADYHIKTSSAKKGEIETEMKTDRNPADQAKSLDWNLYGDGASPTEAGIKKYYFEKLAGINHRYAKQKATESQPTSKEGFWRTNNLAAWLSGLGLLLLLAGTIWAILKRKTLLQWWNSPSELEDELDEDEEED